MTTNGDKAPSAVAATEVALAALARLEPQLHAFVAHDPALARAEAASASGPLVGLTLGVKDIMDTAAYPTRHGSGIYDQNRPVADAACVTLLRKAGAVSLGKTVTTEFAFFRPGPTVNPHDPTRSPGGSSSGSAAAVAAGVIDLALASQTAASLTRPASYCGVVGFKPSFGRYSLAGIKGLAPSFDTLGIITRSVAHAAAVDAVLSRPVAMQASVTARTPRRVGVCRTPWWMHGEADMHTALESAAALLSEKSEVGPVDLDRFAKGADLHKMIMSFEAAQALAWEASVHGSLLSDQIKLLIETGRGISLESYRAALAEAVRMRASIDRVFDEYDILLAPAAPGVAPVGLGATGDPLFSRLWTLLRLPTITLPGMTNVDGLPIGVQVLARRGADSELLDYAAWIEAIWPAAVLPRLHADNRGSASIG